MSSVEDLFSRVSCGDGAVMESETPFLLYTTPLRELIMQFLSCCTKQNHAPFSRATFMIAPYVYKPAQLCQKKKKKKLACDLLPLVFAEHREVHKFPANQPTYLEKDGGNQFISPARARPRQ